MRNHRKTAKVKPKQCMEDTEAITKQQKERNEKQQKKQTNKRLYVHKEG